MGERRRGMGRGGVRPRCACAGRAGGAERRRLSQVQTKAEGWGERRRLAGGASPPVGLAGPGQRPQASGGSPVGPRRRRPRKRRAGGRGGGEARSAARPRKATRGKVRPRGPMSSANMAAPALLVRSAPCGAGERGEGRGEAALSSLRARSPRWEAVGGYRASRREELPGRRADLPPELVSHLHVNDLWKHLPRASAARWPLKRSQTYPGVLYLGFAPAGTAGSSGRCL